MKGFAISKKNEHYLWTYNKENKKSFILIFLKFFETEKFNQPDCLIHDVYNPQSLNRYFYVLNNPHKQAKQKTEALKKFKFARVWGSSVKFQGAQAGLNLVLHDEDVVELHTK